MRGFILGGLLFLGIIVAGNAQEIAGLVHSNHAGTDVLFFNPAGMHHQKDWLSIHIVTADIFLSNNYAYLSKDEFSLLNPNITSHKTGYSDGERPFYIYDQGINTRLDLHIKAQGPSIMFINNEHAFGIFSAARAIFLFKNLTPDLGNLAYYGFDYDPQHKEKYKLDNFKGTTISWAEVGFSYAYQLNNKSFSNWSFGISIRKLYGFGGAYLYVDNAEYNLLDSKTLQLNSLQANMGFSLPLDYNTNELITDPLIKGTGWGFDLGIEFQELIKRQAKFVKEVPCGQKYNDYKYRWGLSIMDIGKIKFTNNAQLHQYLDTQYTWERIDTTKVESVNQIVQEVSSRFYNDPNATYQSSNFTMWLPTSINMSFDYNFENGLYLNSSLVFSAPFIHGNYINKPAILSITPRYEVKHLEASLPLSLYEWKYPRIGIAFRFYFFTIGSDYFTSLLGIHDFNGTDLYFSLKFNIGKGSCTRRGSIDPCGGASYQMPWAK